MQDVVHQPAGLFGALPAPGRAASRRAPVAPRTGRSPRLVLADRSLATLGFFSASSRRCRLAEKHVTWSRRGSDPASVTILAGGYLGQPTTADQDRLVALPLAARNWPPSGAVVNPIRFATADLLRVLRLHPGSGKHHHDIRTWLDVLTSTTVVSDRAVFLAGKRRYVRDRVHVFDRAVSVGEVLPDGRRAEEHHVWLSAWQLQNFAHAHTVALDVEQYLALQRPIARTLALPLHAWLSASWARGGFATRCRHLCHLLGLRHYEHRSTAIEKLGPSLDELQRAGIIAHWSIAPTRDGQDLAVAVRHVDASPRRHVSKRSRTPKPTTPVTESADPPLLEALAQRGVHPGPARRLLAGVPADQPVAGQIAWFDRRLASREGRPIQNPPAFLYRLIRDGLLPSDAPTVEPAPEPSRRHHRTLLAYRQHVADAVAAHLAALSAEERARLLAEHHSTLLTNDPGAARWPLEQQRAVAQARLERHLASTLPIQRLHAFLAARHAVTAATAGPEVHR